jgi:AcrR family transcriptional regulator
LASGARPGDAVARSGNTDLCVTTTDAPAPQPDTRAARTRRRLLDAALVAVDDRGYHATRVDDIVRHAGVSHGAFYLYFDDKQDLFRVLAGEAADEMTALIAELGTDPPPTGEALVAWLEHFVADYRRHGVVIRVWMEDHARDRGLRRLADEAFGRVVADLGRVVDTDRLGPLAPVALLALLERFTYFATSRDLAVDGDALQSVATLMERGFFSTRPVKR